MIKRKTVVKTFASPIKTELSAEDLEDNLNRFIDDAEEDGVDFQIIDIKYTCNETMHFALLIFSNYVECGE